MIGEGVVGRDVVVVVDFQWGVVVGVRVAQKPLQSYVRDCSQRSWWRGMKWKGYWGCCDVERGIGCYYCPNHHEMDMSADQMIVVVDGNQ